MTAALEGGEWSAARPGLTLPPWKTRHPFYRKLGRPQGRSGRSENLVHTGIRSRIVQPVVSRYTGWATGPTEQKEENWNVRGGKNQEWRKVSINGTSGRVRVTLFVYLAKVITVTYSECVSVVLFIQYAKHIGRIILLSAPCSDLQYISTLSEKPQDFRKKNYWTQNTQDFRKKKSWTQNTQDFRKKFLNTKYSGFSEKKFLNTKYLFLIFSTKPDWNIFHCKRNSARYPHKRTYAFV